MPDDLDSNYLADWLTNDGLARNVVLARHVVRALPGLGEVLKDSPDLTKQAALTALRATLITCVISKYPEYAEADFVQAARQALPDSLQDIGKTEYKTRKLPDTRNKDFAGAKSLDLIISTLVLTTSGKMAPDDLKHTAQKLQGHLDAASSPFSVSIKSDIEWIAGSQHPISLFDSRLWTDDEDQSPVAKDLEDLKSFFNLSDKTWNFWGRWLEGFQKGKPLNWRVQTEIAKIPERDWLEGPEFIAKRIGEIEARMAEVTKAALSDAAISVQAARLLRRRMTTEVTASGLQRLCQMAMDAYKREISNALPDCILPLETLPLIACEIAAIVQNDQQMSQKEALLAEQLQQLAGTVSELNARLKRSKAQQSVSSGSRLFAEAFYKKSGERTANLVFSPVLWGGIVTGTGLLLGSAGDEIVDALSHCYANIIEPEAQ